MASLWNQVREQAIYLLRGPGSNTPSKALITSPVTPPPLRTSLVFESHIQEASKGFSGKSKLPQTISSAWDERNQWGDESAASWQGLTAQDRKTIMLDIYLNNSAASSCVDVISKRIFSGGVVVEKVDEEAPDNQRSYDTLMEFLMRVNQDWDFMQLGRSLVQDKLIFGECYAEVIPKGGVPWNIVKVDCIPMGYKANRWGQIEKFYQQMDSSRQKNWLDPQNIIRWWFPHPRASVDPFAPVEKVTDAVVIDKKMMVWMMTFFRQGAKFPYHIEGASDQDEADRLQTWFLQNVMGEKNAHKLPVTWGNAKIVPTGNAGALTMDFQSGMDRMDTMVYGAFGVPPAAVSIVKVGALGGNSGEDQDKSLIYNACDPVKQAFFEKLNDRIVKRGFGIIDYKISSHYADYRSDKDVSEAEDKRIRNGSRTIDEIRVEGGKRPYKIGGNIGVIVTTKEVTPVPRLADMEDEQRQTAQVTLQTAQAGADLAQTKAKQAKEPPAPVPPALLPGQQQQPGQQPQQNNAQQPAKPAQKNGKQPVIKQPAKSQSAKEEGQTLLDLIEQKQSENQPNTGAMVALMILPEVGQQIAIAGGEPVDQLHITLAYLGDMTDLSINLGTLCTALNGWALSAPSLRGRIAGLGKFDAPEGQPVPIIALPDIPGLPEFRQSLVKYLQAFHINVNDEHGYTPHITLMYQDSSLSMPVEDVAHLDLSFSQICLAAGDERTYFPLLGQKQESAEPQYFTGKTEEPQWVDPDVDERVAQLKEQGVIAVSWKDGPNPCEACLMNHGITVKLGMPFPSGHLLPLVHPNCDCEAVYIHGQTQEEEERDKDLTQKLPVIKRYKTPELTDSDLWEGRM